MQDWAMAGVHKFNFRHEKSDSSRNAVYAHDNCLFRISATYSSTSQCVVMVSVGEEHNCIGTGQISHGPSSQQTWLQRILPTTLSISKSKTPITTLPAVSIALHAILSHTTSRSPLLEPPMLRQCPLLRLQDFSLAMTCPAGLLSLKRREDALKLPVLLLESREHELLLSMGPCKTFQTANSAAPAVIKKDTISCAAELNLQIFKRRLPM